MIKPQVDEIALSSLSKGLPAITPSFGSSLAEAGAVCFNDQGHVSGTNIHIEGSFNERFNVTWQSVTDQMKRCWNDYEVTTENGAYAIALLLIGKLTNFSVIERSRKGTGFDYWLGTNGDELFQNKAKLEVSGIRKGSTKDILSRKAIKLKQIDKSNEQLPAYVVIVEFGAPISHMVTKNGR